MALDPAKRGAVPPRAMPGVRRVLADLLRSRGVYDEVDGVLREHGLSEWPRAPPGTDAAVLRRVQPGRMYLHARLRRGRAFLGEAPPAAAATLVVSVQMGEERQTSAPAPAAVEPAFDDSFLFDVGVAVRSPSGLAGSQEIAAALRLRRPMHVVVLREAADGECEVVASHEVEWRSALVRGRASVAVELRPLNSEVSAPAGVLDVDLELLPLPLPAGSPAAADADGADADAGAGAAGAEEAAAKEAGERELPVLVPQSALDEQLRRERETDAAGERRVRTAARAFWNQYQSVRASHVHRLVKLFATSEDGGRRLSCSFLRPLRAGRVIDSPLHAARFVSLLPWRRDCTIGGERTEVWHSLHTLLARGCGDVEDHALLLCSLLLGFGLDAYVCIGTGPPGAHVWVMTRRAADAAVFWEPLTGRRFDVGAVLMRDPDPPESVLPFRAVHCVFNGEELHANRQLDDSVAACSWDLGDAAAWSTLRVADLGAEPRRRPPVEIVPCSFSPATEAAAVERELRALLSFYRGEELKADTVFDDDFSYVLGPALAAYELERVTGSDFGNDEFQQAVRRHLRPGETFRGLPFQFNHRDARRMLTRVLRSHGGGGAELVRSRGEGVRFGLRVRVCPYAEDVCAVWVMIAAKGLLEPPS